MIEYAIVFVAVIAAGEFFSWAFLPAR